MTTTIESRSDAAPVLELSRRFDAPPERVFDAWLGSRWGEWLGPAGVRCANATGEARVGGAYKITMILPDGGGAEVSGVYLELARPRTLAFTWLGCGGGESVVRVDFRPDGDGTLMTLRHTSLTADSRDGAAAGWAGKGGSFDKLAALLAR
jgi:glutathione S-transferase